MEEKKPKTLKTLPSFIRCGDGKYDHKNPYPILGALSQYLHLGLLLFKQDS